MSKKEMVKPRRLKGFKDHLPGPMSTRLRFIDSIRDEALKAGFAPVSTPALEYTEVLLGAGGEETDKQVYRFKDHGNRDVAMRFDLTVPFARLIAENQGTLVFPFKRVQIGDVWRGENTQKGRYREFCQCDLDIIGIDSEGADIEILLAFGNILSRFGFGGFSIRVSDRKILSSLITSLLGISSESETKALIAIDKLAKIGRDKVKELLAEIDGATADGADKLLDLLTTVDSSGDTDLEKIRSELSDEGSAQLDRLKSTIRTIRSVSKDSAHFVIDLSIARGLGYYTGVVFETFLDDLPGFGSIASGGRYDDLASRFTKRELPGVGGSIGLDRLLAGLEELNKLGEPDIKKVFVAIATDDAKEYAFSIAQKLRDGGITCDISLKTGKLGNQFKHANRIGAGHVVTVGGDEVSTQTYSLKNMGEGSEQKGLPLGSIVETIQKEM